MQISAAESRVMEALWQNSPLTPEALIEAVGPANAWAPGTVRTLITRLLRKKAISGAREGDKYHYRPLIARAAYLQSESQGLLDRLFQGEVTPFVAHFAEHRNLTADDVKKLKALIARMEDDDEG